MASIKQPGVEVSQAIVTENVATITPSLFSSVVGPCYQIIKALNDSNVAQSDALAGTYQNGSGTIAYDLPNLKTNASVDSDSIDVYLVAGSNKKLNPPKDEVVVFTGSSASYVASTGVLTDAGEDFTAEGVLNTDVVRLTFRGETVDFPITAVGTTTLTLTDQIDEDLASLASFQVIRNPAQFAYQASAVNANYQFGDETDYITVSAKGDYAGAAGDALNLEIDAGIVASQTSGMYAGSYLFHTSGTHSLSSLSANDVLIFDIGGTGAAIVIQSVISDHALGLASAIAASTNKDFSAGEAVSTTSQTINFSGGSTVTVSETYTGDVVFLIGTTALYGAMSGTTLTNYGADQTRTTPVTRTGSEAITHIIKADVESTGSDGSRGTAKVAAANIGTSLTTSNAIHIESATISKVITGASGASDKVYDVTAIGDRQNVAYRVGTVSQSFGVALASNGKDLEVTLATDANGAVTTSFTDLEDALTDDQDSNYVANVAAIYTAVESGSGGVFNAYGADDKSYDLDGGADANNVILDADLLSGASGVASVYVGYKALRLDVSDQATDPELLKYSSITAMKAAIGPVSKDNPLALGMYMAMLNAPGVEVTGLGISATSTAQPQGTTTAYTSALEFLESQNVYSMAPLTQDAEVLTLVENHVDSMSSSENKSERIAFINKPFPTYSKATLIASGTAGSTTSDFGASALFSTAVDFSLNAEFTAAISAGDTMVLVVSGLTASDDAPTLAKGVDGTKYGVTVTNKDSDPFKLTIKAADASAASNDWDSLSSKTWSLYVIGTEASTAAQTYETVANYGSLYANRRMFLVWPAEVTATLDGNDLILDGYYLASAWAGKVSAEKVGQGFTNLTVAGFTGVKKSSDFYSKSQLDAIAGGGVFVTVQDTDAGPLKCRHQLSTDVSTVQKRELSITKSVDYVAKTFRDQLLGRIGVFNITNSFLDSLAALCQATMQNMVGSVVKSGELVSLEVDANNPDTVIIKLKVTPYYPSNYILLTIEV